MSFLKNIFELDPKTGKYTAIYGKNDVKKNGTKKNGNKVTKPLSAKKTRLRSVPGFDYNPETDSFVSVPLDPSKLRTLSSRKPSPVNSSSKTPKVEHSALPRKVRIVETAARKKLFKASTENDESLCRLTPKGSKRKSLKKNPLQASTPQFDRIIPKIMVTPSVISEEDELNVSQNSTDEFLLLERLCKTPKKSTEESPVSSVCNLFQKKMILGSEDKENDNNENMIPTKEIRELLSEQQNLLEASQKYIKLVLSNHEIIQANILKLFSTLDKLEGKSQVINNNNNIVDDNISESGRKRRSVRLQKKTPLKGLKPSSSTVGSPIILKSGDLRKCALTKSLVNKCQEYQMQAPRIKTAIENNLIFSSNTNNNDCNSTSQVSYK